MVARRSLTKATDRKTHQIFSLHFVTVQIPQIYHDRVYVTKIYLFLYADVLVCFFVNEFERKREGEGMPNEFEMEKRKDRKNVLIIYANERSAAKSTKKRLKYRAAAMGTKLYILMLVLLFLFYRFVLFMGNNRTRFINIDTHTHIILPFTFRFFCLELCT